MSLNREALDRALLALGEILQSRALAYELVAVGGSGLLLLGAGVRPTKDLDVLAVVDEDHLVGADPLPGPLVEAARDVGATFSLAPDWLNPGPTSLLELGLPEGFRERLETRRYGTLIVHLASRRDQIFFKLYAGADMGPDSKHIADLIHLEPSYEELLDAARWATTQDSSIGFREMLVRALAHLGIDDADSQLE